MIEEEELVPIVEPIPAPVPAVVVPVVPPPSKKITKTATPKKVVEKPVNAQTELAEDPPATTGTVQITGAEAYLEGPNGRVEPGALLPGSYDLFANVAGGQFRRVRSITIEAGQNLQFHCGMGTCRQVN